MTETPAATARAAALRETLAKAKSSQSKTWLWIAGVLVIAVGAGTWYFRSRPSDRGQQFQTAAVHAGTLTVSVTATGEIQSLTEVNVGTEISGIVDKVLVDFNSSVVVGQLLATINTDKLRAQSDQAKAVLSANRAKRDQVEATLTESQMQFERLKQVHELSGGKVPSRQELDAQTATVARAQADVASADAQVRQSEASVAALETDLSRAAIRSPIKGLVLDRQVDPGQTVAATFQTPTLFTLAEDLRRMKLMVDVDEADVGAVSVGQAASFRVDAYPNRTFQSKVTELRSAPVKTNGVVTYQAVLSVDNKDLLLKPGMTATADIVVTLVENAVLVPNAALRFTPPVTGSRSLLPGPPASQRVTTDNPATRVWVVDNGAPKAVEVTVGATDGQSSQLTSGQLKAGDPVIVDIVPERK